MSADRFEARVADWLEDGPESAPADLLDVALDHARTHPRSRLRGVEVRARRLAPALAAAAVVLALAGGSLGALALFRSPATPVAPVHLTATEACTNRVAGAELVPQAGAEGGNELRGRIDACRESATDERVTGELTRRIDAWLFDPDATWFGTIELRNEGGAWSGTIVGTSMTRDATREGRMSWVAIGSGAYRGLAYRATAVTDAGGRATVTGTIEGIGDDATAGSTWCWVDTADPDLSVENPTHRVAMRTCLVTASDDRVAGTAAETRTIDVAADGSTRDNGTFTLTTAAGGTWVGSFIGSGNWYVPGEVTGMAEGGGALAGQRLRFRIVSEDGMHGALVASIAPAG